jgi:hypothetical protein
MEKSLGANDHKGLQALLKVQQDKCKSFKTIINNDEAEI